MAIDQVCFVFLKDCNAGVEIGTHKVDIDSTGNFSGAELPCTSHVNYHRLIIPALVLFAKLPMKKAVGTSLIIIAAKSLIGFLGDIGSGQQINFQFIAVVSVVAIAGIFLGSYLSRFIESRKPKTGFGWFVLVMGIYVIFNEVAL